MGAPVVTAASSKEGRDSAETLSILEACFSSTYLRSSVVAIAGKVVCELEAKSPPKSNRQANTPYNTFEEALELAWRTQLQVRIVIAP